MTLLDVINSNINDWLNEIKNCSAKNHEPHRQVVITSYNPKRGRMVTIICSNCGQMNERYATGEEIDSYGRMLKFEITI